MTDHRVNWIIDNFGVREVLSSLNAEEFDALYSKLRSAACPVAFTKDEPGKFVRVEWDPKFFGGDYDDVGAFAYIELVNNLNDDNLEERFEQATGASRRNIIHYTFDELFVKDPEVPGEFVEESEAETAEESEMA